MSTLLVRFALSPLFTRHHEYLASHYIIWNEENISLGLATSCCLVVFYPGDRKLLYDIEGKEDKKTERQNSAS